MKCGLSHVNDQRDMDSDHAKKPPRDLPFYRTSEKVRTTADIIQEAKTELFCRGHGFRSLSTRRPETPLEDGRRLFRQSSARDLSARPPSSFRFHSQLSTSEPNYIGLQSDMLLCSCNVAFIKYSLSLSGINCYHSNRTCTKQQLLLFGASSSERIFKIWVFMAVR